MKLNRRLYALNKESYDLIKQEYRIAGREYRLFYATNLKAECSPLPMEDIRPLSRYPEVVTKNLPTGFKGLTLVRLKRGR